MVTRAAFASICVGLSISRAVAAAISTLIACSSAPSAPVPFAEGAEFQSFLGGGKIKHVVYVVQENRSFDDIFQGYPHADTVLRGKDSYGKTSIYARFR